MRELTKKVCLLGDFYVGKTSLVRRFVEGRFDERYLSSIGVKVDRQVLRVPADDEEEVVLTLMLWDLAGDTESSPVVPSYYRGASGAIVVCDLTRPETAAGAGHYVERLFASNPEAAVVLAANKADLAEERRLSEEDLAALAATHRAPLYLTSAKTGEHVEDMFRHLGSLLLKAPRP